MSDIEDRLRQDLPALADVLAGWNGSSPGREGRPTTEYGVGVSTSSRRRLGRALALAACVAAAMLGAVLVIRGDADRTVVDVVDGSLDPGGAGTWETVPEAPISSRSYPVSMWTGTEALFWAGSSLDRSFAYGDAAAYDPESRTWRRAQEPGWGHPGLTSVEVDGQLYATAKGSIGRLDVATGAWVELPQPDGVEIRAIAAGDGGIWGLGPASQDPEQLGITFYDPGTQRWTEGGTHTGPGAVAGVEALRDLEQPVLWTGSAVIVWSEQQPLRYDPAVGWATLPPLPRTDGHVVSTHALVDGGDIVVLVELSVDEHHVVRALRWQGAGPWTWIDGVELPVRDLHRTTVATAGVWTVLLPSEGAPVTVHLGSGRWLEHDNAPILGIERPGTVWTGSQLIVWGGVHTDSADVPAAGGMIWTPPEASPDADSGTAGPGISGDPAPSWTGPDVSELPPSGIVITQDSEMVFYDFDGDEVARATGPVATLLESSSHRMLVSVRPGGEVDAAPIDRAETPNGCQFASSAGGVWVALCGGEPQQPQVIEVVSPTGDRRPLAEPPADSNDLGHWRWAVPSPDGRWILATWSGECEARTAFLIPNNGDAAATTVYGQAGLDGATNSVGIGWTPDGRAIVQLGTGACGTGADEPGVYLFDPSGRENRLLVSRPESSPTVHLWSARAHGNDAEWVFANALEQLGLEGCCGEPSHGGQALTAGVRWQGFDIPVGATPPGSSDTVPFNDLVLSSEPIDLDRAPALAGQADLGPFVAYTCGDRIWTFGGAGTGDRATNDAVRTLAATILPYLGCTVGERPLAPGHGTGGP